MSWRYLRTGESPSICPFLQNNGDEAPKGPSPIMFSTPLCFRNGQIRGLSPTKMHLIKNICYFDSHCKFYLAHRDKNVHRLHVIDSTVHSWEIMDSFIMAKYCRCILNQVYL